jgi:hypothetical protein
VSRRWVVEGWKESVSSPPAAWGHTGAPVGPGRGRGRDLVDPGFRPADERRGVTEGGGVGRWLWEYECER